MGQAQTSYAAIVEGHCWECGGRLERILSWAECIPCGRRFNIAGRHVTELIAVSPEYFGTTSYIGGTVLNRDGTVERPRGDGLVTVTDQAEWIVCEWAVA